MYRLKSCWKKFSDGVGSRGASKRRGGGACGLCLGFRHEEWHSSRDFRRSGDGRIAVGVLRVRDELFCHASALPRHPVLLEYEIRSFEQRGQTIGIGCVCVSNGIYASIRHSDGCGVRYGADVSDAGRKNSPRSAHRSHAGRSVRTAASRVTGVWPRAGGLGDCGDRVRVRTSGAEARTYFSWLYDTSEEVAERLAADTEIRPQGLKPTLVLGLYAALKRRSSTVPHIFTVLHIFV